VDDDNDDVHDAGSWTILEIVPGHSIHGRNGLVVTDG
jgi:hypothetical protein